MTDIESDASVPGVFAVGEGASAVRSVHTAIGVRT
jgi:hypothetical protein